MLYLQAFAPEGALGDCGAELRAVHFYQKEPPEAMNAMREVIKCALPHISRCILHW